MDMSIINHLPSPSEILRLALSLLNSTLIARRVPDSGRYSLTKFDVDPESGFFPPHQLPRLPEEFEIWELALTEAQDTLSLGDDESETAIERRAAGEAWRANIRSWSVLDTDDLEDDLRLQQRAHYVLSWLVHFYVHSMPPSRCAGPTVVPKSLSIPLVNVSRVLGMAPVLTFADTVLWNWESINPERPTTFENMRFGVNLFSGTEDERNFYIASARAELRGVEMLRIIDDYQNLPDVTDFTAMSKISRDLTRLSGIIDDISDVIQSVRGTCEPHVFYSEVRPWFEGSDAKGPDGPGWVYEGVDATGGLDLSGPSAGQSSIMHALDIFLDIDHKLQQKRYPAPSEANKKADHGFMERMRRYMPGKHREYLSHIAATPRPLRELAMRTPALREPYDAAVMSLKRLRDLHMRIACLYIVTMSRSSLAKRAGCPVSAMLEKMERDRAAGKGPVRGTGGNEVSLLLKAGRDATRRAVLRDN